MFVALGIWGKKTEILVYEKRWLCRETILDLLVFEGTVVGQIGHGHHVGCFGISHVLSLLPDQCVSASIFWEKYIGLLKESQRF